MAGVIVGSIVFVFLYFFVCFLVLFFGYTNGKQRYAINYWL